MFIFHVDEIVRHNLSLSVILKPILIHQQILIISFHYRVSVTVHALRLYNWHLSSKAETAIVTSTASRLIDFQCFAAVLSFSR